MTPAAPLIVTAAFDPASFAWFDALRRAHFPPARNLVPAHVTLFHALPGAETPSVLKAVREVCAGAAVFDAAVRGPWSLGRGVAYRLESADLSALRAELARRFAPWLTPQDQALFRPHVTVQNKVEPEVARGLLETLQHDFEPFEVRIEGLDVWRYLGGPWGLVDQVAFRV